MCLGDWMVGPDRQRNRRYSTQPAAAVQRAALTSQPGATHPDGRARKFSGRPSLRPGWLEGRSTPLRPPLSLKLANHCGGYFHATGRMTECGQAHCWAVAGRPPSVAPAEAGSGPTPMPGHQQIWDRGLWAGCCGCSGSTMRAVVIPTANLGLADRPQSQRCGHPLGPDSAQADGLCVTSRSTPSPARRQGVVAG
jgi:hypothetical protein